MKCPHCGKEVELRCLRCGFTWTPRSDKKPKACPRCKNVLWNTPRKDEGKQPPLSIGL